MLCVTYPLPYCYLPVKKKLPQQVTLLGQLFFVDIVCQHYTTCLYTYDFDFRLLVYFF